MIWTSIPVMTAVDLGVIALMGVALWLFIRNKIIFPPLTTKTGPALVVIGLCSIGLFYFADLMAMHALPLFVPMTDAMAAMENLHHNLSWLFILVAVISIVAGFRLITRDQRTLIEKHEISRIALKESEARFRDFAEATADWFWEMDENLRFTYHSPRYFEITGFHPEDKIGTARTQYVDPVDFETNAEKWAAHMEDLEARRSFKNFEYGFKAFDGRTIYARTSGTPVFGEDGTFFGYRGTGTDITERVAAEEGHRQALVKAEEANQAKSEFLAAMSHELRTPLNAILGFADILSHQHFGLIGDKNREYAGDIKASGEHLLTLVNDLLDISTIEAGQQSLVKEKLSTLEIVTECERIVEDKARSHGIDLVTKVPKDLPPLYADRRATKQILLNLLSNAVKFTPEGGKITVSVKASKKNTTFKVADTGKGIPPEKLPKLTDPFTRGGHDPYLAEDGWGLGLTITKSLIDLHDGTLDIKSTVGKGTTVTVTFPNGAP